MELTNVKLSIIIPTKNRYQTLIPVLAALLKHITDKNVEFIVQDNSDNNDEFLPFLNANTDFRLKYNYHAGWLSLGDNTINAITQINGKYALFIGDDDLVSPYIMDIIQIMEKQDLWSLIYKPAHYWWSSVDFVKPSEFNQKCALWMLDKPSKEVVEIDTKAELQKTIVQGGVSYFNLPRFYHGIIRTELLHQINKATGTYLPGGCPDISFATALGILLDKHHYMHYPVSVFGASKNSGGGMSAENTHHKPLDEMTIIAEQTKKNWSAFIPRYWSAHTWYANSVQEVLNAFKTNMQINFLALYGSMYVYEFILRKEITEVLKRYAKGNVLLYLNVLKVYFKKKLGVLYRDRQFKQGQSGFSVCLAKDVNQAMDIFKMETNLFAQN